MTPVPFIQMFWPVAICRYMGMLKLFFSSRRHKQTHKPAQWLDPEDFFYKLTERLSAYKWMQKWFLNILHSIAADLSKALWSKGPHVSLWQHYAT